MHEHAVVMYALLPTMEGANTQLLNKAIDEMVEYYKGDDIKLARELRWMGIILHRAKALPRGEKRKIEERLNMWDDLFERDPKTKKIRAESQAKGEIKGLQRAVVTAVKVRFPHLTELAQQKVARINKPDALNLLLEQVSAAPDEHSARLLLELTAA